MTGRIVFKKHISRDFVLDHPCARFVFGDNLFQSGRGGQALAMRGCFNAIGVPTKRAPSMKDDAFFSDRPDELAAVQNAFNLIRQALEQGRTVYVPEDGIGTGLAELATRSPFINATIVGFFRELAGVCPWEKEMAS